MAEARPEAVVSVAAGRSQETLIHKARALGFAVIGVDQDPTAPGLAACDARILHSTWESGPIREALRPLESRYALRAVLVRSAGPPVATAAELARALGLPGVAPETARLVLDKACLLEACARSGIAAPRVFGAVRPTQLEGRELPLPCIVKPSLPRVGKQAVRRVEHERDLPAALAAAAAASSNGRASVEEWVPGRDVGLVAFVQEGRLLPVTLLDELNQEDAEGGIVARGFALPSVFCERPEELRVLELAQSLIGALRIGTAPFMLACRVDPGGRPRVIELHLDFGGDGILDELLPRATRFDALAYGIRLLAGEPLSLPAPRLRPTALLRSRSGVEVLRAPTREALETRIAGALEPPRACA
jgi:hypothetical protein